MKLCCFFNYAPLYRESIYKRIDETFDTQFYFGEEVEHGKKSGIKKLDYSIFRRTPIEFKNKLIFRRFGWRTKASFLALKKYDTFLITGDFVFSYIPFLITCKLLGKRVYGWGHGLKRLNSKMRPLELFFYKSIAGFFAYGEQGRQRLVDLGFDDKKFHVIYNSLGARIDRPEDLSSDIYRKHFGNDDPTLIFIGRLTTQKRLDWLIRAHGELNNCGKVCNLVIVGTGSETDNLRKLAETEGYADRIWFYGECYDTTKTGELLYNASVCVSPGNVGLTALDAMRFGTPVISHNNFESQMPEYETIKDGETGFLYKEGDFFDFCVKIRDWLSEKETLREETRRKCRAMINGKWNSDYQLEVLKDVLDGDAR